MEDNGNKVAGKIVIVLLEDGQIHVEGPQNLVMFCGMLEMAKRAMLDSVKKPSLIQVPTPKIPRQN